MIAALRRPLRQGLTEDGSFEYACDAENRLIRVEPAEDDPNQLTADDKKIEYEYDYLSRRVRKAVYAWDPNAADWSAAAELDLRFMHHERKLLLELDGLDSLAKVRKYVWGPGSVGPPRPTASPSAALNRLLAIGDVSGSTDYVCFTNRAGSVVQLLDRSDGSIDAKYVYGVNGDTVSKSGTYADDNPLRYRAMYFDKELDYADTACDGLYCAPAGNYYSPRLGRALVADGDGELCSVAATSVAVMMSPIDEPDGPFLGICYEFLLTTMVSSCSGATATPLGGLGCLGLENDPELLQQWIDYYLADGLMLPWIDDHQDCDDGTCHYYISIHETFSVVAHLCAWVNMVSGEWALHEIDGATCMICADCTFVYNLDLDLGFCED